MSKAGKGPAAAGDDFASVDSFVTLARDAFAAAVLHLSKGEGFSKNSNGWIADAVTRLQQSHLAANIASADNVHVKLAESLALYRRYVDSVLAHPQQAEVNYLAAFEETVIGVFAGDFARVAALAALELAPQAAKLVKSSGVNSKGNGAGDPAETTASSKGKQQQQKKNTNGLADDSILVLIHSKALEAVQKLSLQPSLSPSSSSSSSESASAAAPPAANLLRQSLAIAVAAAVNMSLVVAHQLPAASAESSSSASASSPDSAASIQIDQLAQTLPSTVASTVSAFKACHNCGLFGSKTCSRCKSAVYCSAKCQTTDYPKHKKPCLAWAKEMEAIKMQSLLKSSQSSGGHGHSHGDGGHGHSHGGVACHGH